jgi:hypothetical protein
MHLATVRPDRQPRFVPVHGNLLSRPWRLQKANSAGELSTDDPKPGDVVAPVFDGIGALCDRLAA